MSEQLYRDAAKYRGKVKKREAELLVLELAASRPEEADKFAQLLAFFAESKPKAKTVFGWVASAVAKKDVRKYLQYVFSDGSKIVGTDGTALHAADTDLPTGLYDPVTGLKMFELDPGTDAAHPGKYPEWKRILPRLEDKGPILESEPVKRQGIAVIDLCCAEFALAVPQKQWELARSRCDKISLQSPTGAVRLDGSDGCLAVIMPMLAKWAPKV